MKKKVLLYGLLLGSATFLHAQSGVGIGVELPHGSTILDVEASNKGISLPNVALTSLTASDPIQMTPKDGLLVFNTTEDTDAQLTKGFYYWGTLGTGKGWLPIAANQSVVLTKEGDDYYFTQGDTTLNLTEEISNVQRYALMVQQTEDENSNGVKLATKFNDGKEGSADVLLTETLTGLTRGKEGNTERIAYTYTDETGEAASTQLTITSDVIESFEEVISNTEVKNLLDTFISESTGGVSVEKDNSGQIVVNYKNAAGESDSFNLTSYIHANQKFGEVSLEAAQKGKKGAGINVKPNPDDNNGAKSFVETLTPVNRFDHTLREKNIEPDNNAGFIYYTYVDESGDTRYLTVSQDVAGDFEKIINYRGNTEILTEFITRISGDVKVVKEFDDFVFVTKNGSNNEYFNISKAIRDATSVASMKPGNRPYINFSKVFNSGVPGSPDVLLEETLTRLVRKVGDVNTTENIEELVMSNGPRNDTEVFYEYFDEGGKKRYLTISQDIVKDFERIVGENKDFMKDFIQNLSGEVGVHRNTEGEFYFSYLGSNGVMQSSPTITEMIKAYRGVAKMVVAGGNGHEDSLVATFNNGTVGAEDVKVRESVTSFERVTLAGDGKPWEETWENYVLFKYKSESHMNDFTINFTDEMAKSFHLILKRRAIRGYLESFFRDIPPRVNMWENNEQDVFLHYNNPHQTGETFDANTIDLTKYIRAKQAYVYTDVALTPAVEGVNGVGIKVNPNKEGVEEVEFTETRTLLNRFTDREWLANFEVSGDVTEEDLENKPDNGLDLNSGFTYYKFQDESGAMRYITVSQDVSNDFEKILEKNRTFLEEFIQEVSGGDVKIIKDGDDIVFVVGEGTTEERINITQLIKDNSSVASLTVQNDTENTAKVGLALKFSDGKQTNPEELSFAETLTTLTKGVDDTTGLTEYTYTDEAGEPQTLAVSQDVSNDFSKIVNANQEVIKTIVGDYTGNIKIERVTGLLNEDGEPDFDIQLTFLDEEAPGNTVSAIKFINDNASIVQRPKEEDFEGIGNNVRFGLMIDGPDKNNKTYGSYTSFETLTKIEKDVAPNGHITYEYYDERLPVKGMDSEEWITYMPITQDVIDSFKFAIANEENKALITTIVQESSANPWNVQGTTEVAKSNTDDIYTQGKVVIGGETMIENPKATNTKLSVGGDVVIDGKFFSTNSVYADYVFEKYFTGASDLNLSYEFKSLDYVKEFVEKYNHLPGVTKISDVERTADGKYLIDFSELSIQQLEKIEELYLHTIEQQEEIDALKTAMDDLSKEVELLKASFQQFMHNSK